MDMDAQIHVAYFFAETEQTFYFVYLFNCFIDPCITSIKYNYVHIQNGEPGGQRT